MKKIICLFALVMLLSGCASFMEGWNNGVSNSQVGKAWVSCESCNRNFTVEYPNSSQIVTCPYCGREQDVQYAINRYNYDKQQQDKRKQAKILEDYQKSMDESYKEKMRINKEYQENVKNIFNHKRSTTNCRSNGFGGIVCDTTEQ